MWFHQELFPLGHHIGDQQAQYLCFCRTCLNSLLKEEISSIWSPRQHAREITQKIFHKRTYYLAVVCNKPNIVYIGIFFNIKEKQVIFLMSKGTLFSLNIKEKQRKFQPRNKVTTTESKPYHSIYTDGIKTVISTRYMYCFLNAIKQAGVKQILKNNTKYRWQL